jgi:hypothetical protein
MFHGRSANELGLASAAVVLSLIQRLEKKGTIKREDALALLGDAADRLVATPRDTTVSMSGAALRCIVQRKGHPAEADRRLV